ncbi:MAG: ribosomal protein S18-alanine N-acetyltransferase [Cellulosilyticaceae bacterium]
MSVRVGCMEDAESIHRISANSFAVSWSLEAITEDLRHRDAIYFVAEQDAEVVGFIGMRKILDEGEITNVAVCESMRGMGIGQKLVYALLEYCQREGIVNVLLEVRESNEAAKRTYEKTGFKVISRRKGYYQHPKEDALIMQWLLT